MTGSPRRVVSWLFIVGSILGIFLFGSFTRTGNKEYNERIAVVVLTMQSKIMIGADRMMPGSMDRELAGMNSMATSPEMARLLAILNYTLAADDAHGVQRANELLDRHRFMLSDSEETALHDLVRSALNGGRELSPVDRSLVEREFGWFGKLLLSKNAPPSDPAREEIERECRRAVLAVSVLLLGAVAGFMAGCVLLMTWSVLYLSNKQRLLMEPPASDQAVFLRAFAVYLGLAFVLAAIPSLLGWNSLAFSIVAMAAASLTGVLWPFVRGIDRTRTGFDIGFHRGRGVAVEVGCGLVGYLAVLPIVAAGILASIGIVMASEALFPPAPDDAPRIAGHPAALWIANGGTWTRLLILAFASGFAPFFEETMFRGALQGSLREKLGPLPASLAVGVIFATIHPQGFSLIPALLGLSLGFSLLREWRGSLIAPITAHAVHNGILVCFMWILF